MTGAAHTSGPSHTPIDAAWWRALAASIDARQERMVRFRRRLHATPEPSGEETATTATVAEALREAGYEPRVMDDDVGVVVDLDLGASSDTFIALRAELDCVRVNDDKQTAYASTRPGLCHACGHDAHSAILLTCAQVLREHARELRARSCRHHLRFIFQPAEETCAGARSMIKQGAIDGVSAIIALHVDPFLDSDRIGVRRGPLTAACKVFRVTIRGRSGHTARPFEAIDPIPAATNIVSQFYQLAPRSMDSRHPLALSVASINAGTSYNAIPDEAVMLGTLRTARLVDLDAVQQRMQRVCEGVARSTGAEVSLDFLFSAPATDNDAGVVDAIVNAASSVLGPPAVQFLEVPSLGGEDFAYYQELIPGAIVRLGVGTDDKRTRRPLHSSLFDLDETALSAGVKVLARSAIDLACGYGAPGAL